MTTSRALDKLWIPLDLSVTYQRRNGQLVEADRFEAQGNRFNKRRICSLT
jgi:hypothetical protein